jgi:membrane dipeptidase
MKAPIAKLLVLIAIVSVSSCQLSTIDSEVHDSKEQLKMRAEELAQRLIIADTHIDVPYRLAKRMEDISVRTPGGDFDYPRANRGGLNLAFMSIYIPARYQTGGAKKMADRMIDMVEGFALKSPDKFVLVNTSTEIQDQFLQKKVLLAMGMENGAPIQGDLDNLEYFYDRGIRYITLTHSKNNHICDSSYDLTRKWKGLSPFGRQLIHKMNQLGIMIDTSHVSDQAFFQIIQLTQAPIIASHSSCRHFTPDWERNMSDEMLVELKNNNGVIQINFGSSFVNNQYREKSNARKKQITQHLETAELDPATSAAQQYAEKYAREHPIERADISDVVDHIDHVVQLIGINHVGIGSDFDGVGDSLPNGLKDVSDYPNLIHELLNRGYSDQDIEKICSGNLLRVWRKVEQVAQKLQSN